MNKEIQVLFIAEKPYFALARHAQNLVARGIPTGLIYTSPVKKHIESYFHKTFFICERTENSEKMMERANKLCSEVHYFQAWMWKYKKTCNLITRSTAKKKIVEFYDITSFFAEKKELEKNWDSKLVSEDLYYEKELVKNSTLCFARFPQKILDQYSKQMGCPNKVKELHPCSFQKLPGNLFRHITNWTKKETCVYAGGLIPNNDNHPRELFPERGLIDTFRVLLDKGLSVEVFHDPNRPLENETDALNDFISMSQVKKNFLIKNGISPRQFSKQVRNYLAGILLSNIPKTNKIGKNILDGGIGTKFFSYLEAGLPLLVNSEYKYMKELVVSNNIGLALTFTELQSICKDQLFYELQQRKKNIQNFLSNTQKNYASKLEESVR